MREKSRFLFWVSVVSLACGAAIIGLAIWNADEVEWSPLTKTIAIVGSVLGGVSLLGILTSQGCTFCCHVGLYLYLIIMSALSLAGTAFVITAGVKQSDWVQDMAEKYSDDSQENIDHLKDKYDEFMPFVIAFGVLTVLSCILGFIAAWRFYKDLTRVKKVERTIIREKIDKRELAEREKVRKKHHDTVVQMTQKYGNLKRDPNGRLLT
eukprot:g2660.t1